MEFLFLFKIYTYNVVWILIAFSLQHKTFHQPTFSLILLYDFFFAHLFVLAWFLDPSITLAANSDTNCTPGGNLVKEKKSVSHAQKKSALNCMDGFDNQVRTRATTWFSKEIRARGRGMLWRIARWNGEPNSSSFQELYITLVCPLRLLSVTLLRRSTEKNYVPRNAFCKARRKM